MEFRSRGKVGCINIYKGGGNGTGIFLFFYIFLVTKDSKFKEEVNFCETRFGHVSNLGGECVTWRNQGILVIHILEIREKKKTGMVV